MSERERLVLYSGIVGDYDGAYDWVDRKDFDKPEYAIGNHVGGWPEDNYTIVEIYDEAENAALKQELRDERKAHLGHLIDADLISREDYEDAMSKIALLEANDATD